MRMEIIPEVGDKFRVISKPPFEWGFAFQNKHGGTSMANWDDVKEYLLRNGDPSEISKYGYQRVFVGEFDIEPLNVMS